MKSQKLENKILIAILTICKKKLRANFKIENSNKSLRSLAKKIGLGLHPKWDSLVHLDIIVALEKKFKVKANSKNINKFANTYDFFKFICYKKKN
tara:strand:- start:566 stop:850 length:285 start_codon:yes stop_codon:yes gene_type:complete